MTEKLDVLNKGLKYALYLVCVLLVVVFCVVFTIPGNQGIAWLINQFSDAIKIENLHARFYDDEPFDVTYSSQNNSIVLQSVQLKLVPHALKDWTVALDVQNVLISLLGTPTEPSQSEVGEVKPTNDDTNDDSRASFSVRFDLTFDRISYQDASHDVDLEHLSTLGRFNETLQVDSVTVNSLAVTLHDTQVANKEKDTALPTLSLPQAFPIPFAMTIADAQAKHIEVVYGQQEQKTAIELSELSSVASASKDKIVLDKLQFAAFDRVVNVSSSVTTQALDANVYIVGDHEDFTLQVNGPWQALEIAAHNKGKLPLELIATVNLLEPYFPFELKLNLSNWDALPLSGSEALSALSVSTTLQGDLQRYSGRILANSMVAQLGLVDLDASYLGSLEAMQITKLAMQTPLGKLGGALALQFAPNLDVQGEVNWLDVELENYIDIPTKLSGSTRLSVSQGASNWQIKLDKFNTQGTVADLPLTFNMSADLDEDLNLTLDSFLLTLDDSQIQMQGKLTERLDFRGQWLFDLEQLGNTELRAKGEGRFTLQGSRAKPKVDLDTHFDSFQFQDLALSGLQAQIQWGLTKSSDVLLSLSASQATVKRHNFNDLQLKLAGPINNHRITAFASHAHGNAELELTGGLQDQQWQGRILKTQALFDNREFKQSQITSLQLSSTGSFKLSPYCLIWDESQLCLEASKQENQETIRAKADISELDVALLNPFLSPAVNVFGHVSGQVIVSVSEAGIGNVSANMIQRDSALLVNQNGVAHSLALGTVTFDAQGKGNRIEVGLRNDRSPLGHFSGLIKTTVGKENPEFESEFELSNMDLGYLDPLLTQILNREFQFKGAVNGKLATSGSVLDPNIFGDIVISNLAAQNERSPLELTDSNLAITMNGKSLTLSGQLNDVQAGTLALAGGATWQNELALDINIQGKSFWLKPQEGIELKLDTDMQVIWSEGAAKLVGQVSVPYGRIAIKELPEGAVAISDDQIFVDEAETEQESLPVKYLVNLKVNVLDDVKIDSFGLKSYLTGNLLLNKQNDTPVIGSGELSLLHGTFKAFGQDLIISKGQIGFSGALDKPYLHVNAIRNPENTANGVVAGVQLTGLAKAPKVALYSEPAMDQAQVLSYLLNGQPLNGGGETDKNVLLTNLLLSQSLNRSEGVLQKVGGGLGLQDVNVGTKGSGEGTQVEVSGFLTPSVQVKYSVGVFDSLSEIAIRYQILSKLYVEITSGLYDSIDLLYRFDWGETEEAKEEKTKEEKKP